jgi:hypothetical protein
MGEGLRVREILRNIKLRGLGEAFPNKNILEFISIGGNALPLQISTFL